jgi:hypothetical protein
MKILKGYLSHELYRLLKSEIEFVEKELEQFLKEHKEHIKEEEEKTDKNDKTLSDHDKKKMQLWEAVFQDEFREAFYKYNNCLSRLELDGRKQKGSKDDRFLELVTRKHNDPEWLPQSQPVYGYHSRLNVSHVLPLHATYEVKDVKKTVHKYERYI